MTQLLFRLHFEINASGRKSSSPIVPKPDAMTVSALRRCGLWIHRGGDWVAVLSDRPRSATFSLDALAHCLDGMPLRFHLETDRAWAASSVALPAGTVGFPFFSSRYSHIDSAPRVKGVEVDALASKVIELIAQPGQASCPEGELWLFPDDLKAALPATAWRVRLQARAMPWAYYVINRSQSVFEHPVIRDRQDVPMRGPVSVRLDNGEAASRFDSRANCHALQPDTGSGFALYGLVETPLMTDADEVCLVRDLPIPDPLSIEWIGSGEEKRICATAYVYL